MFVKKTALKDVNCYVKFKLVKASHKLLTKELSKMDCRCDHTKPSLKWLLTSTSRKIFVRFTNVRNKDSN